MSSIGTIISEPVFLNAYHILRDYYKNQDNHVVDVNLRLIEPYFELLNDRSVKQFYQTYIKTDLIYAVPELCMSEIVSVPKNMTGVREYRFMSSFAHILYTAFGLVFVECSMPLIESLDFKSKGIHSFSPTRFIHGKRKEWEVKNKYREEYANFTKKLVDEIEPGDVVIKTDISSYFENINHKRLLELLDQFSPTSSLREHGIKEESYEHLEFYLDNLMQSKIGVPQGRKNFTSDFFGYFYLVLFDNEVRSLCESSTLEFKACVRYVDDTFIIFRNKATNNAETNKELVRIEQRISSWIFRSLGLSINPSKTDRRIIANDVEKEKFIREISKSVSQSDQKSVLLKSGGKVTFADLKNSLKKLKFSDTASFKTDLLSKDDKESLKFVFSPDFKKNMKKKKRRDELLELLANFDIEVTVDEINILMPILTQDSDKRFEGLVKNLMNDTTLDIEDRRIIHIILAILTHFKPTNALMRAAKAKNITQDSYGKYLAMTLGIEVRDTPIAERIGREFGFKKNSRIFKKHLEIQSAYNQVIFEIIQRKAWSDSLTQAIKLYNHEIYLERWDTAFNHFQNVFHETMKARYCLADTANIQDISKNLNFLSPKQELLLRKFYDRRNFNPISHPSKKGMPAEKVGRYELEQYRDEILAILQVCFAHWKQEGEL